MFFYFYWFYLEIVLGHTNRNRGPIPLNSGHVLIPLAMYRRDILYCIKFYLYYKHTCWKSYTRENVTFPLLPAPECVPGSRKIVFRGLCPNHYRHLTTLEVSSHIVVE